MILFKVIIFLAIFSHVNKDNNYVLDKWALSLRIKTKILMIKISIMRILIIVFINFKSKNKAKNINKGFNNKSFDN